MTQTNRVKVETDNYIRDLYRRSQDSNVLGYQFSITYRNMTGRKHSYNVSLGELQSELSELIECGFRVLRVSKIS